MAPSNEPLRLHELRQFLFEELDEAAATDVRRRLTGDTAGQERLRRLSKEQEQHRALPSQVMVDDIVARLEGAQSSPPRERWRPPTLWRGLLPVGAVVAAAVAVLFLRVETFTPGRSSHENRPKGAGKSETAHALADPERAANAGLGECETAPCPTLEMFVKDASGIRLGVDGARLHAGDWVQFRYVAQGRTHLFIVSVDDDGIVTPLYPEHEGESVTVQPAGRHVLEGSVILDDAIGPERFYAFFSSEPLQYERLAPLLRAIRDPVEQTKIDELGPWVDQVSILIYKEAL